MPEPWWKSAVVYQIYPRSFADSNGDGVGDLEGIRAHLEHLEWLGVDAVWISPFYRSPMADSGYDVSDYCDVDPLFGTLADFDRLLAEAHARGLRVLVDWVPNHTSDRHPWFEESRSSRDNPRHDWYVWRDGTPERPPNNWKAAFGGDAWTWDEGRGQWYLHLFLPEQPDLNWDNPEVVAAMHQTMRFWLDRGVDGFRIDVVHCLAKNPDLPDLPAEQAAMPISALCDEPGVHDIIRDLRRLLGDYPGERMMVGEVYLLSTKRVARYYGNGDELHLAFNFPPLYAPWEASAWRTRIGRVVEELEPIGAWPTWVLSNHDNPRHRTRYGGSEARARAAAVLLLTMRGTPFLYQGEELGLLDADVPQERQIDPGGRDGPRAPLPWDASPGHGWGEAEPWLPWPPEAATRNVETERAYPGSVLHLYRRLLEARRSSPALRLGSLTVQSAPEDVVVYERADGQDRRVVLVNYTDGDVKVDVAGDLTIEVSSDALGEGDLYKGVLAAGQAVVLTA